MSRCFQFLVTDRGRIALEAVEPPMRSLTYESLIALRYQTSDTSRWTHHRR